MKIKDINFFWISSFLSWVNTFKTTEFCPKIENFQKHSYFCTTVIQRKFKLYVSSSCLENTGFQFFFWIFSLFSWANTVKLKNLHPKLKISNNTQIFAQLSS